MGKWSEHELDDNWYGMVLVLGLGFGGWLEASRCGGNCLGVRESGELPFGLEE